MVDLEAAVVVEEPEAGVESNAQQVPDAEEPDAEEPDAEEPVALADLSEVPVVVASRGVEAA